MSVLVRFTAELRLVKEEIPSTLTDESLFQAVQDQIGHTGAVMVEVDEYEEQTP